MTITVGGLGETWEIPSRKEKSKHGGGGVESGGGVEGSLRGPWAQAAGWTAGASPVRRESRAQTSPSLMTSGCLGLEHALGRWVLL